MRELLFSVLDTPEYIYTRFWRRRRQKVYWIHFNTHIHLFGAEGAKKCIRYTNTQLDPDLKKCTVPPPLSTARGARQVDRSAWSAASIMQRVESSR